MSKENIIVKKWTEEEVQLLSENIGKISDEELIELFNGKYTLSAIKTKANKKLGYSTSKKWTKEEDDIMIKYYSEMSPHEILAYLPKRNYNGVIYRAQKLKLQSCVNREWTQEEKEYIINHWELEPDYIMAIKLNRTKRSVQFYRNSLGLHRVDVNSLSYPTLSKYIRGQIWDWKKLSMKNCGYKCVFTGSKEFQIHHLYGVSNILNDVLKNNDITEKDNLSDYSEDELSRILKLFKDEQSKYPLGVCVSQDIHVLFHSMYGQYYNTPEQWYRFEEDYRAGLYREYITNKEEKLIS